MDDGWLGSTVFFTRGDGDIESDDMISKQKRNIFVRFTRVNALTPTTEESGDW